MGANNFNKTMIGKFETAGTAYRLAKEEAQYEFGHDNYNGSISTCNFFELVKDHPRYNTKDFWSWVDAKKEKFEKRDCIAVEITGTSFTKMKNEAGLHGKRGIKAFLFFGLAAC